MNVADGDDVAVLVGEEAIEHLIAAIAQADETEAKSLVGTVNARLAESAVVMPATAVAFVN